MYTLQVRQSRVGTERWQWRIIDAAGVIVEDNPTIYPTEDDARSSGDHVLGQWKHTEAQVSLVPAGSGMSSRQPAQQVGPES
jgi:hypothetical protein